MAYRIYVGSYSEEISVLSFDPATPSLSLISSVKVGFHPSWVTPHPTDPTVVFTGLEEEKGTIVALKFDQHGHGFAVGESSSGGASPCALVAVGSELLVGNVRSSKPPCLL